jgi:cobyrinic acid a,c-diamide synthase
MEEIQNQIERSRLRWFGHVKRTDEHRIPNRSLGMKMNGRRPMGRPST